MFGPCEIIVIVVLGVLFLIISLSGAFKSVDSKKDSKEGRE